MKINLKILTIVFAFVMLVSMACNIGLEPKATATPLPTATDIPTQTPYPTNTPYPTYTPVPTATPTERVVIPPTPTTGITLNDYDLSYYKGSGPTRVNCPSNANDFPNAARAECYEISDTAMGILYFDSKDNMIALAIAMTEGEYDSSYDAGVFAAQASVIHGWNVNDLVGLMDKFEKYDVIYTYGSLSGRASQSSDGKMVYMLFMPVNNDNQG